MPRDTATQVDNNFVGGLKTEFTGLNFPDNSALETFNCVFNRTGLVERRLGFDYEDNNELEEIDREDKVVNTYYWKNVGGEGQNVSILVVQIGSTLHFYKNSDATISSPLSAQKMASTVDLGNFLPGSLAGQSLGGLLLTLTNSYPSDPSTTQENECQFSDGHGYLFVHHPLLDPFYCEYDSGTISAHKITLQIRDFEGIPEPGVSSTFRDTTLTDIHQYNLANQGWGKRWMTTSTSSNSPAVGDRTFTVADSDLPIEPGDRIRLVIGPYGGIGSKTAKITGTAVSYTGTTLVVKVTNSYAVTGGPYSNWVIVPDPPAIEMWNTDIGNFPSNSDKWWLYKNSSNEFSPKDTISDVIVSASSGPASKGYFILDLFNQRRGALSLIDGLNDVVITARPRVGAWYAGRVWYAGIDYGKLSETLFFSQIVESEDQFGKCYQTNDPTSEETFDLLPSDGGSLRVQGSGLIYKLVPIQNGLLIFAEKGIWFVRGNQGIGFTATDYSIVKLSSIFTQSNSSFVDVMGYPMWWNDEGIYGIVPKQDQLSVESLTNNTIASFYQSIPDLSKLHAKGYYDPLNFRVQWLYRSTPEADITSRYEYDRILVLDTNIQAFYPWTIGTPDAVSINGIVVIGGSGSVDSPPTTFKYLTSIETVSSYNITFSEEKNEDYEDWSEEDFSSYFIIGYRVYSKGMFNSQLPYIDFHGVGSIDSQFDFQSRWDWTTSGNTGRWSSVQRVIFDKDNRAYETRRRRTRGSGRAVQLKFSSISGMPMSLIGWSTVINVNKVP